MIEICQNSDRQWIMSKNKYDLFEILQKEYDELLLQFRFLKQITVCQHEELNSHEIIDEQYKDDILIMIAKQISIDLGQSFNDEQTSQRNGSFIEQKQNNTNQQIFKIFLIDLVKGQIYDEQQPYFKKIEESKLTEFFVFKLKPI